MQWISFKDRLPPNNISVLVYADPFMYVAEYWYDEDQKPIFDDPPHVSFNSLTHWMPLPEPPND